MFRGNAAENYSELKFCHLGSHPFFVLDRAKTLSGKSEIVLYYKRWKLSTVFFYSEVVRILDKTWKTEKKLDFCPLPCYTA